MPPGDPEAQDAGGIHQLRRLYLRLRRQLRRIRFLRSSWYLLLALVDLVRDPWRTVAAVDQDFARQADPWKYNTPEGQQRFQRVVKMLDAVTSNLPFEQALEVACAEGAFTEFLAPRCKSLLAVDLSPTALERARGRRAWGSQVRFQQWNLGQDPLPGTFDLIVAMDVLCYFTRPGTLHKIRDQFVAGLRPGGYLLVGDFRLGEMYETTWWSRHLLRGGKWITEFMAAHPALRRVATDSSDTHMYVLLQKVF